MAILSDMKSISAGKFKDQCLRIMDSVARTRIPVVVTKRKRPVVKVIPYAVDASPGANLEGSILKEQGNPFGTDETWDAGLP
jgi:prevent-host-death family protein